MSERVLVVEDEPLTRELYVSTLAHAGFAAQGTGNACACRAMVDEWRPDLILLDLGLPDADGLSLARELRARTRIGLIVVSRRDAPETRVAALELGCDDYLVKPVHLDELCARVRAVLRRKPAERRLRLGRATIDREARTLTVGDAPVLLTRGEFTLIDALAAAGGGIVDREQLCRAVSRGALGGDPRTVDALVRRIRRKLEAEGVSNLIATAPGLGYRLSDPLSKEGAS
jgi:DNA-binding response OmpR family regulator